MGHLSRRDNLWTGVGLVNLATLAWSTNMLLGRWLRFEIGPITLAAARFAVAALCYVILLRRQSAPDGRLVFPLSIHQAISCQTTGACKSLSNM